MDLYFLGGVKYSLKPASITDLDSLNNLTSPILYTWVGSSSCPANAPFSNAAGYCLILPTNYGVFQISCKNQSNFNAIYIREFWGGSINSWFPWKSVTMV